MPSIKFSDLVFGVLNFFRDGNSGESGDRRRTPNSTAMRMATEAAFSKNTLNNVTEFNGVIVSYRPVTYCSYTNRSAFLDVYAKDTNPSEDPESTRDYPNYAYKVYIPEVEPRPAPKSDRDPVLITYPDVYSDVDNPEEGSVPIPGGTLVAVKYEDVENLFNPRIVRITGGPILFEGLDSESLINSFGSGTIGVLGDRVGIEFGAKITIKDPSLSAEEEDSYPGGIFEPRTQKAVDLLTDALKQANLPEEWAMLESTHYILGQESGGKVGIPNFRYDYLPGRNPERISRVDLNPETWKEIWIAVREGRPGMAGHPPRAPLSDGSTSTGLGQLNRGNVEEFYPGGVNGIGNAKAEAIGYVRYISDRYGDPDTARSMYGRTGTYFNTRTRMRQTKGFREGY